MIKHYVKKMKKTINLLFVEQTAQGNLSILFPFARKLHYLSDLKDDQTHGQRLITIVLADDHKKSTANNETILIKRNKWCKKKILHKCQGEWRRSNTFGQSITKIVQIKPNGLQFFCLASTIEVLSISVILLTKKNFEIC